MTPSSRILKLAIVSFMLLGLPLLGVFLYGRPLTPYLQFPPTTFRVLQAPFSWVAFLLYSAFLAAVLSPFFHRALTRRRAGRKKRRPASFPWWGWTGMALAAGSWFIAWTRFPFFSKVQPHTFTPIWWGYIILVSALAYRNSARCMLVNQTRLFLALFPASALFWWFFEFLNRFVHNWYYVGKQFDSWEYFWFATLPFSTVLPAVLTTRELIQGSTWIKETFTAFLPLNIPHPKLSAVLVLALAGLGLALIGLYPDYLFPLIWVSPFLIMISLQVLFGDHHVFSLVPEGDWTLVISSALSALVCGFFWEMWNFHSFAKWVYTIPFVQRFHIFEMPLLGYAGYLPFGLECSTILHFLFPQSAQYQPGDTQI
ncbi:MAG: hypothetical protein JRJ29_03780 [Deltaproteobacteria bacterium]|nr:hypothetical protein [Deltaproteobacteria bacterium]